MPKLSIVVPVYYNEGNIPSLYDRLSKLDKPGVDLEFVFVDDGSGDNSFAVLKQYQAHDKRIKIIKLSRNFGSHVAILAGLTNTSGDCASIITADLQDPPELILTMYEDWLKGNEIVLCVRKDREESFAQVLMSNLYYRLMRMFALREMPKGGFDFVLLDRKVINVLVSIKEKNTTIMGLILWVGFKHSTHYYTRQKREIGKSRWTLSKKVKLFLDSFIAFSYLPIRLMSTVGILLFIISLSYSAILVFYRIFWGQSVEGWTSLMVVVLLLSGIQLLSLGIIGEYLWRNFDETRNRPIYIIDQIIDEDRGISR